MFKRSVKSVVLKYWSVFKISFQQEFAYRINFIMWRARNVLQIFLIFFLWDSVFSDPARVVFGYDRAKILTYIFGIMIVRALVLSARAIDVSGDISRGDLSNYLVKPISYFKYWMTRDISIKALNLVFAAIEFSILYLILRPPFFIQTDFVNMLGFLVSIIIAILIFFNLLFIVSSIPFWAPELGWGGHFIVTFIMVEFLSGALYPLDILPQQIYSFLKLTPFPYLIFFPIKVYLGQVSGYQMVGGILISLAWAILLWFTMKFIWKKGLLVYEAFGR